MLHRVSLVCGLCLLVSFMFGVNTNLLSLYWIMFLPYFAFSRFSLCGSRPRRRPWSLSCDHGLHCSDGIVREQQQHPAEYQDSSNYSKGNSNRRGHAASLIMKSYNIVFTQVSYCLITSVLLLWFHKSRTARPT